MSQSYIIKVKNSVSDVDKAINGSIVFLSIGPKKKAEAYIQGFPSPWTNPTNNKVVIDTKIQYTSKELLIDEDSIANTCITNLQLLIQDIYGVVILLEYKADEVGEVKEPKITPLTGELDNEVRQTTDASPTNQKIFNVEYEDIFSNSDLGELFLIGREDNLSYEVPDEYLEDEFQGEDEGVFFLPNEDIYEFETELNNGTIDTAVLEEGNTKPTNPGTKEDNMKLIAQAARDIGLNTKYAIYSMIAIASGECGLKPQAEGHIYSGGPDGNIRNVFKMSYDQRSRATVPGISKRSFFSIVYGEYKPSRVGNRNVSDGGLYYGRGFIQLTGHENYTRYNKLLNKYFPGQNINIVTNPDLVNDPKICAKLVAMYFIDRVKTSPNSSGYLESALRAVGNDAHGGYDKKRSFYNKLMSNNTTV